MIRNRFLPNQKSFDTDMQISRISRYLLSLLQSRDRMDDLDQDLFGAARSLLSEELSRLRSLDSRSVDDEALRPLQGLFDDYSVHAPERSGPPDTHFQGITTAREVIESVIQGQKLEFTDVELLLEVFLNLRPSVEGCELVT